MLIVIVGLQLVAPLHADESRVVGRRDGLELILTSQDTYASQHPSIECKLHNTTNQDIPFDLSGPTCRLSFQLLSASGAEIAMEPAWKRSYGTVDATFNARHASAAIKSGSSRTFVLHFDEAYGERWKSGVRLVVSWEPGIDWSTEKPYVRGRGLSVGLDIQAAGREASTEEKLSPDRSDGLKPQPPALDKMLEANPLASSVEPASSTPQSITVMLTVAALVLLWLLLKRQIK